MIPTLVSQSRGIGVFDDGTGLGVLDGSSLEPVTRDEPTIARLLHGARDIEALEVENLQALTRHLVLRRDRETLLHATLLLCDATRTDELRTLAAQTWVEAATDEVWPWVQGVLLATPAPTGADFLGAASRVGERGAPLKEIAELQPAVIAVDRAWRAIPQDRFNGQSREDAKAAAVRAGHFGALVRQVGSDGYTDEAELVSTCCVVLALTQAEHERTKAAERDIVETRGGTAALREVPVRIVQKAKPVQPVASQLHAGMRRGLLEAHAQHSQVAGLDLLWRELASGKVRVVDAFSDDARFYLVTGPSLTRLNPRTIAYCEAVLAGVRAKQVAIEAGVGVSSLALSDCLKELGLGHSSKISKVPPLLVMAAMAHRQNLHVECRRSTLSLDSLQYTVTSATRPERRLGQSLTRSEHEVVRLLVEGKAYQEVATLRRTTERTVANQLASAFRKLNVSGRIELLGKALARSEPGSPRAKDSKSSDLLHAAVFGKEIA